MSMQLSMNGAGQDHAVCNVEDIAGEIQQNLQHKPNIEIEMMDLLRDDNLGQQINEDELKDEIADIDQDQQ